MSSGGDFDMERRAGGAVKGMAPEPFSMFPVLPLPMTPLPFDLRTFDAGAANGSHGLSLCHDRRPVELNAILEIVSMVFSLRQWTALQEMGSGQSRCHDQD